MLIAILFFTSEVFIQIFGRWKTANSVNLIKISTCVDWHSAVCINGRFCLLKAAATCNITKIIKTTICTFNTFYMYLHEWSVRSQGWEGHREDNAWVRLASGHLLASYCTTLSALCILLHNPCCIVQCYMQVPWLDPSPVIVVLLTYHAHFGDLILLFEYGMASDQMNGCLYYRTYWYISIFEFLKL